MDAKLVQPEARFEQSYVAYIRELGDEVRHPFPLDFDYDDFAALLARLEGYSRGENIPDGFVPHSTFWLVQGDELVGVSNLRHRLNERLEAYGGHIGLSIRPSRRSQGLGRLLLKLTAERAKERGISTVHVHCYRSNTASSMVILRNGGVLVSEGKHAASNEIIQRYHVAVA